MSTEVTEGESIEKKIDRMVETNEPIGETAPMIYTKKTDGVIPAYDISQSIVTGKQIGRAHV